MTESFRSTILSEDASLIEAIKVINDGAAAIGLVTSPDGRLVGIVTDGDVRRGLIAGATLEERCLPRIMERNFRYVSPSTSRAEVLDLMRALTIKQVPILDEDRRLVGLHLLHDLLGTRERENAAVIMAGGRGVRLLPLTETVPKPMIHVAGRPILERLVLHLVGAGIRRIYLSVNYLAHKIEDHFGDGANYGCRIEYLREDTPLGTGGALSLLPEVPGSPLLVMNGDLVTQLDVGRMLAFHENGSFALTCGLRPYQVDIPFGVAEVQNQQLLGLQEKPVHRMLVNAGVYVVSPETLSLVPQREEFPITRLVEMCLERQLTVGAHLVEDEWLDVGRHDELKKARGLA